MKSTSAKVTVYFEKKLFYSVLSTTPISKPMQYRTAIRFAQEYIKRNPESMVTCTPAGYVYNQLLIMDQRNVVLKKLPFN